MRTILQAPGGGELVSTEGGDLAGRGDGVGGHGSLFYFLEVARADLVREGEVLAAGFVVRVRSLGGWV